MGFFRRSDPQPEAGTVIDTKSYKTWKEDGGGAGWIASLTNEVASSRPGYTSQEATPEQNARAAQAGAQYVFEEAVGLESSRPNSRFDRRSVQPDPAPVRDRRTGRNVYRPERLFSIGGIFGARQPDALSGRVPTERWPGETQRGRGPGCTIPGCTCGQ